MSGDKVVVIGAGVVGLSIALEAQARGLDVCVVDRVGPAAGASAGNAGAFAFADILPLASPRIMRQAPKWLLDPNGPLSLPPRYALKITPWMWRFWRACRASRVADSTRAQASLMALSAGNLDAFLAAHKLGHMLWRRGQMQVYEGQKQFDASLPGWEARAREGIAFRHLKGAEIAEIQPGLSPQFTHASFTPDWCSVTDPLDYTQALAKTFTAAGGKLVIAEATALTDTGVMTSAGPLTGRVVLAAGAHSHLLARTAGAKIPLETERGYNTTLPADAFDLKTHITFSAHGFVITSLSSGIRVGGAVELGGLKLPPNYSRADAMLKKAKRFLPGLNIEGGKQWMGFRPSLPDSLPALGPLARQPNTICAFGHGHLGLTQSTGTAAIIADMLEGKPANIDLAAFSPQRFSKAS